MRALLSIFIISGLCFSANATENYKDLDKADKKALVKALNKFMVPYARALTKAHVKTVKLMSKCMKRSSDINAFPADLLEYDESAYCYGNKKILNQFNKIWEETDPMLPDTEYSRYRDYQTVAQLGHEAYGAQVLAEQTAGMIRYNQYDYLSNLGHMIGKFRHDYDGYINADLSTIHFSRGDGCFLEILVGFGDNKGSDSLVNEICD